VTTAPESDASGVASFEQRAVRRIARNIMLLGGLAPLLALLVGAPAGLLVGVAVGSLVAAANFLAFERISVWVVRGSVRAGGLLMALLVVKMTVAMVVVFLIIRAFGVDAIGFVIGLSTLVVGLLVEAVRSTLAKENV
jgi:hypothetical protein